MPARLALAALLCALWPQTAWAQDPPAIPPEVPASSAATAAPASAPSANETRLAAARSRLTAAQDALQVLVEELVDDHTALVAGPDAPALKNRMVLAFMDVLPAAEARFVAATTEGRRPSRGTRSRILKEVFADALGNSSPVDARLSLWISERVAEGLAGRGTLDGVSATDVLVVLDGLFVRGESFYVFWNRAFHQDLPAARQLTSAQEEYETAGLALDRERYPERYGPRGEAAPVGMVVVPGGSYELGPNAGFKRAGRKLTLQPFALDRREVTSREYKTFVDAQVPGERRALLPRGWSLDAQDAASFDPALSEHPVTFVSWEQAAAFAAWAGKRLPTEDEWEAAAAGPTGRAWPWGDSFVAGLCNGGGASAGTLPVESFPNARSSAGCFDLAGNVWEWTSTLDDGRNLSGLPDGPVNMIIRGGGFESERDKLTCRYRWIAPAKGTFAHPTFDRPIGFRCAADL